MYSSSASVISCQTVQYASRRPLRLHLVYDTYSIANLTPHRKCTVYSVAHLHSGIFYFTIMTTPTHAECVAGRRKPFWAIRRQMQTGWSVYSAMASFCSPALQFHLPHRSVSTHPLLHSSTSHTAFLSTLSGTISVSPSLFLSLFTSLSCPSSYISVPSISNALSSLLRHLFVHFRRNIALLLWYNTSHFIWVFTKHTYSQRQTERGWQEGGSDCPR